MVPRGIKPLALRVLVKHILVKSLSSLERELTNVACSSITSSSSSLFFQIGVLNLLYLAKLPKDEEVRLFPSLTEVTPEALNAVDF